MDIGFLWDADKYEEVKRKHRVLFYEVVSAFEDPNGYEIADPAGHEDRWMSVGKTVDNRLLAVVYSDEELPVYRLITAFDAGGSLVDEYYKRSGI